MIKVLRKALDILEIMSQSKKDVFTLNELSQLCDIPKSTIAGILKELCEAKYLEKDTIRGYRLGVMSYALSNRLNIDNAVIDILIKKAKEIHQKTKAHVAISTLKNYVRHSIIEIGADSSNRSVLGANAGAVGSATGLMLLSQLEDYRREAYLEYYNLPKRFSGISEFNTYLNKIKDDGYVIYSVPGKKYAFAVPVFINGKAKFALGLYYTQPTEYILDELKNFAHELENELENI